MFTCTLWSGFGVPVGLCGGMLVYQPSWVDAFSSLVILVFLFVFEIEVSL